VLAGLREAAQHYLKMPVPPAYEEFLARVDGLQHNGLIIYGSVVFVDANLYWRKDEYKQRLLIFAESPERLYVYDMDERRYQVLERPRLGVVRSFAAFQGLINAALSAHRAAPSTPGGAAR
jgi:hypothetical protein